MAEFLTTHGTAFQIENVIAGARKQLTLVSPFLKLLEDPWRSASKTWHGA